MIDVHIIAHPTQDRSASLDRILESLESAPVDVHVVPGVAGVIGAGRHTGFHAGHHGIKSYLDDDDPAPEDGIYDAILEEFERFPSIDALCTRERSSTGRSAADHPYKYYDKRHLMRLHHIMAYRYDSIKLLTPQISDCTRNSEHTLAALMLLQNQVIKHLPVVGYTWEEHGGSSPSTCGDFTPGSVAIFKKLWAQAKLERYETHIPEQGIIN